MKNFFIVAKLLFFSFAFSQISHTIIKGDTPYNISKKYGITINELYKENPQLKDGFKIGEIINIKDNTKKNIPIETKIGRIVLQEKQTLYSITKQFRITEEELRRLNPNLKITVGKEISLPLENINKYKDAKTILTTSIPYLVEKNTPTNTKTAEQQYVLHKVTSDDTTFGIIHKYGINIDELTELNPQLSNGLKVGSTLKIRKYDAIYTKTNGNALNVALMLPFGFDSNDEKYRNMATDFLSGALLAIERNTRNGLQLDVKIIDSGNEQSFKKSLSQINQKNTDLIFGPFFKSNIIDIINFNRRNISTGNRKHIHIEDKDISSVINEVIDTLIYYNYNDEEIYLVIDKINEHYKEFKEKKGENLDRKAVFACEDKIYIGMRDKLGVQSYAYIPLSIITNKKEQLLKLLNKEVPDSVKRLFEENKEWEFFLDLHRHPRKLFDFNEIKQIFLNYILPYQFFVRDRKYRIYDPTFLDIFGPE